MTEAARVLEDVAAGASQTTLKEITPAPTRTELGYPSDTGIIYADFYEPNQPIGGNLVLVPGFTPHGKDDRRVVEFAKSFARARFRVLVPDVPGSRNMSVSVEDARVITDAAVYLAAKYPVAGRKETALLAVSYAVGPTVLATLDPLLQDKVSFIVGIGGYYDTDAVITFVTTGHYRTPGAAAWQVAKPEGATRSFFLRSNVVHVTHPGDRSALLEIANQIMSRPSASLDHLARKLTPEGRALYDLIDNRDPERVDDLIRALPPPIRENRAKLALKGQDLAHLQDRLVLIHGSEDRMIPYTESMALADAVPGTELFLIDGFSHINTHSVGTLGRLQLIRAVDSILERRMPAEAN